MIYLPLLVPILQWTPFSYVPALYYQRSHLFSRLRYPNLCNDSSTRSCPESLIIFGAFLCAFFYSSEAGRRWVQHPQSNPSATNIVWEPLCLWRKRIYFARGVLTSPKQAGCWRCITSLTYRMLQVPWSLGWKYLVCWFGEQMSAGLETSLQFNSATCSSRLKLREGLLPHRQALIWRWANNPLTK